MTMTDKVRQRALLEENYYDDRREIERQRELIFEKEIEVKRETPNLMEKMYALIPENKEELGRLDLKFRDIDDEFHRKTNRLHQRLEEEQQKLDLRYKLALDDLDG